MLYKLLKRLTMRNNSDYLLTDEFHAWLLSQRPVAE